MLHRIFNRLLTVWLDNGLIVLLASHARLHIVQNRVKSSLRGLSAVKITLSARRSPACAISGRLPLSRSPPRPNTATAHLYNAILNCQHLLRCIWRMRIIHDKTAAGRWRDPYDLWRHEALAMPLGFAPHSIPWQHFAITLGTCDTREQIGHIKSP